MLKSLNAPFLVTINNPCGMQCAWGMSYPTLRVAGFNQFKTMKDGLLSFMLYAEALYMLHGKQTVRQILADLLSHTHHSEQLSLEREICQALGLSPLHSHLTRLHLDMEWAMLDFTRAFAKCCAGPRGTSAMTRNEYFSINDIFEAIGDYRDARNMRRA